LLKYFALCCTSDLCKEGYLSNYSNCCIVYCRVWDWAYPQISMFYYGIFSFPLGAVHKGRPQRQGGGFSQMRTGGRGIKDLSDVHKLVLFLIVSACFADALYG